MGNNITKWTQLSNEWSNPATGHNDLTKSFEVGGYIQYKEFGIFDFTPTATEYIVYSDSNNIE